ncbi:hypothetical protein SUGI_0256440 [Cryptomeria japonica]|nr:hypothetical protein SUGI_0256440 [Cryptomeria japonica]
MLTNPSLCMLLLEKDLVSGTNVSLTFVQDRKRHFLPRTVADEIPFSSDKLNIASNYAGFHLGFRFSTVYLSLRPRRSVTWRMSHKHFGCSGADRDWVKSVPRSISRRKERSSEGAFME